MTMSEANKLAIYNSSRLQEWNSFDKHPRPLTDINGDSRIKKSQIIELPKISDPRGNLTFIENNKRIPFEIQRVFYLYDVPSSVERGSHAHKETQQFLVAISGSFDVVLDDGYEKKIFHLNRSHYGLYIYPLTWCDIVNFSSGAVCMALTSTFYDESDYYRNYEDFIKAIKE